MAETATSSPSRARTTKRPSKSRAAMASSNGTATAKNVGYLKKAASRVTEASSQLVEWGKDHPVKAAAAGAALLAVTSAIYATMRVRKARAARR